MSNISREQVEKQLKKYQDPYLHKDLLSAGAVKRLDVKDNNILLDIELGFPVAAYASELSNEVESCIRELMGVADIEINVSANIIAHAVQKNLKHMESVKNIIAVASGKGGVGKSTTTANLALALQAEGARVGVLDADIYGPSQTRMLGMQGKPETRDGKLIEPKQPYGLQAMSIGLMVEEETPMIWRGPMVTQALQQLLSETRWDSLDYLLIDLPPGTGDVQLTLSQQVPVSGAVIVTTPQDIALLDARKALKMFEKVEVPVLGIVENMSTHICSQCGHVEAIFGEGGGEQMSADYGVDLLGALPLNIDIRRQADGGEPTVAADPDSDISKIYREIGRQIAAKLSIRSKDYSSLFPNIVIENN